MRKFIFLMSLIVAFVSCSKDKKSPTPPEPKAKEYVADVKSLSDYDMDIATTKLVLWVFTHKPAENKVAGRLKIENKDGKLFNIKEHTVGTSPAYFYYKFEVYFEAENPATAVKLRDAMIDREVRKITTAYIKNIDNNDFDKNDLPNLNKQLTDAVIAKVKSILKADFDKGRIAIMSYSKNPLTLAKPY